MLPEVCDILGQVMLILGTGRETGESIPQVLISSAADDLTG